MLLWFCTTSVQWQPDGLTIHTEKWLLGACPEQHPGALLWATGEEVRLDLNKEVTQNTKQTKQIHITTSTCWFWRTSRVWRSEDPCHRACRDPDIGPQSAEDSRGKRVLEHGVRAPVFYGNLLEKTVFHKYLQELYFVLSESPKISGNLWEFMGECNLGIQYSSSLSQRCGEGPPCDGGHHRRRQPRAEGPPREALWSRLPPRSTTSILISVTLNPIPLNRLWNNYALTI